jgi:hypothetical protein
MSEELIRAVMRELNPLVFTANYSGDLFGRYYRRRYRQQAIRIIRMCKETAA